ncbi:hypothetical protein LOC54_06240 [Acetobacter sp. AN02]|uniref:hypothetical protein n=1 Tax=Acetobacter sp. AN02 TaxID=2894186 RepID=UPI0024343843|nr:hypothetical protein [Acetobacter sp. AN02]MDG6094709.1 hypothetical protein [Acetobacter sp. AN02]
MGHNHAKPATAAQKLERLLNSIPADWSVKLEREALSGLWSAITAPPGSTETESEHAEDPVTALENAWRKNRPARK